MRVSRIQRIQSHRIFRDFIWPNSLEEFATFNLIYGWNGSGKTTLSNLFRCLQKRNLPDPAEGEIEYRIDNIAVTRVNLSTAVLPAIRVFNRDSVDRNVFEVPNHQLPPVYFIGEESVDKERRVLALKRRLGRVQALLVDWRSTREAAVGSFERFCTDQARQIKNLLTTSGGGAYNNYDSRLFKQSSHHLTIEEASAKRLSDDQRGKFLATKEGVSKDKIELPNIQYPDLGAVTSGVQQVLQRAVLSTVLPELQESSEVAAWVGHGVHLHTGDHASEKCRFCTNVLPKGRLEQLEAHFNNEFKKFQGEIATQISIIEDLKERIEHVRLPSASLLYPHLVSDYKDAIQALVQQKAAVLVYFNALHDALLAKGDEPFKLLNLYDFFLGSSQSQEDLGVLLRILQLVGGTAAAISAQLGYGAYARANAVIAEHNRYTENFKAEVAAARKALEEDSVAEALPSYQKMQAEIDFADRKVKQGEGVCAELSRNIEGLESSIKQHQKPAEELNREMVTYLGRDELQFEVKSSGYTITRNGEPALNLCEGEKTAIAFMYFLKSLKDADFDQKNGIIVIDDPVSSLDANSLYCAFGLMRERTRQAHQLFILTHNFTFFRQVRNWFQKRPKSERRGRPERFYMLASEIGVDGKRGAKLAPLDPLLHDFESEYHYLFKRVFDEANYVGVQRSLMNYYGLPNIARRLLEAFLAFRFPDAAGDLFQKLECVSVDGHKKTRILRFLHTESHFDQIGDSEHDMSLLSETPQILRDILELMRTTDMGHYDGMLAVVRGKE